MRRRRRPGPLDGLPTIHSHAGDRQPDVRSSVAAHRGTSAISACAAIYDDPALLDWGWQSSFSTPAGT